MRITEISSPKDAEQFLLEKSKNSVASNLEIQFMNSATLLEVVDIVLSRRSMLSQDNEIDFGLLRVKICKHMDDIKEAIKKI
jgi:hypothetical protein